MEGYKTLKAARADGFDDIKKDEYGGEQISLKGHSLVRNPKLAVSETEWGRRGYNIRNDAPPHALLCRSVNSHMVTYYVYRDDQVVPKKRYKHVAPKIVPILAALWRINRSAKRYRDAEYACDSANCHEFSKKAQRLKINLHELRLQALQHLLDERRLVVMGYCHLDGRWVEVLSGDGYTFHRPCPRPKNQEIALLDRNSTDARPVGFSEPKLKDAILTVETYLKGRGRVQKYSWPQHFCDSDRWDVID